MMWEDEIEKFVGKSGEVGKYLDKTGAKSAGRVGKSVDGVKSVDKLGSW